LNAIYIVLMIIGKVEWKLKLIEM